MTATTTPRLNRAALAAGPPPPARIVHLGVGAFHRSHQAWYTARAADADQWGITGFTGRSAAAAERLGPQDGVYTLVTRDPDGDRFELIGSVVGVQPGERHDRLAAALAAPATSVVTLTITETAYDVTHADLTAPRTALARLLHGLSARRDAGGGPLTVVPCDNLPDNGTRLAATLRLLAEQAAPDLVSWLDEHVSYVSTSVDRITPRAPADLAEYVAAETGWYDEAPVIAEPFSDWVLAGDFPAGRPAWETAGARFATDVRPYEARKLWMLNGAHSALACAGLLRGHRTVDEAIGDPACRVLVGRFWAECERHLPPHLDLARYREDLLARFGNARMEHRLTQIAEDTTTKLRVRVVPVALRELAAGRRADGCAAVVAEWVRAVRAATVPADGVGRDPLAALSPELASSRTFRETMDSRTGSIS
ncbi:oxidoreductase [Prauserella sp. PE36]|uniref:mannitol dehydrogenase family protein n=1 Tax=Prauserella sp. PE36 TaxID=1504709 RepID=UPI000DE29827|nr:mannitol dehydrogenase family protein [Prauserella sp. PE36]RBM21867.1 oxidoreductase [Prauserella sp. PE36]